MAYKKTKPNQLTRKRRECMRCMTETIFTSELPGLKGKPICPRCEYELDAELKKKLTRTADGLGKAVRQHNKRSNKATKPRGKRGSNQYQTRRKTSWLEILLAAILATLIFAALSGLFSDDKSLPVHEAEAVFISPLPTDVPASTSPEATPTPSVEAESTEGDVADFLRRVHRKESSSGTNTNPQALHNQCKAQNRSNEYGYGGMAMMICFDDHGEASARVARWFREHRTTRTEAQTYCYYAYGRHMDTCDYWEEVRAW